MKTPVPKGAVPLGTGVLLGLLMTEAALWVFFPIHDTKALRVELEQSLPGLKDKVLYTRNEFGFRSLSMKTRAKPERTVRIIALGASTTEQMNQNTEDLWSGILETKLQRAFEDRNIRIEVAAWGRGGEKVFDRVRFAREELPQYKPDIVITLEGVNDLAWNGGPGYIYKGKGDAVKDKKKKWYTPIKELKRKYSQIYKRVRRFQNQREILEKIALGEALEYHTDSLIENHEKYVSLPFVEKPLRDPDPIEEFGDGMEEYILSLQGQGIEAVVLTQPVLWKSEMSSEEQTVLWFYANTPNGPVRPGTQWLEAEMKRYNLTQLAAAKELGASFVPLDEQIPGDLNHFFDDCHFTDLGNHKVAEVIFPHLASLVDKVLNP